MFSYLIWGLENELIAMAGLASLLKAACLLFLQIKKYSHERSVSFLGPIDFGVDTVHPNWASFLATAQTEAEDGISPAIISDGHAVCTDDGALCTINLDSGEAYGLDC